MQGVITRLRARRGEAGMEASYFSLIELVILATVIATLYLRVTQEISNPHFELKSVATDVALLLESAPAAPGSLVMIESASGNYTGHVDTARSTFVAVGAQQGEFLFHPDAFLHTAFDPVSLNGFVRISKAGNELQLAQQKPVGFNAAPFFPPINTAGSRPAARIVVDADQAMRNAAKQVIGAKKEGANPDLLLVLRQADDPVLYIAPNPESRKLASLILSHLPAAVSDASIVPVSPAYLKSGDPMLLSKVAVEVQMSVSPELGAALEHAVEEYFQKSFTLAPAEIPTNSEVFGDALVIS